MKNRLTLRSIAYSSLSALAFTGSASAAIVATGQTSTTQDNFFGSISTTDLINGLPSTATTIVGAYSGDTDGIYDGVAVASSLTATSGNIYLNSNPDVTMTFNLTGSATGYDLTSIASFAAWSTNTQHHAAQYYDVQVSFVGNAAYTSLLLTGAAASSGGQVAYDVNSGTGSSKVTITDDSSGVIASGVDSIRFVLKSGPDGLENDTVYNEIDVFGTPTSAIPEPSAALLGGIGLLALLRRRR